eukprot:symbB.v1.2.022929.t3/scaffold2056.1/size90925/3
MVNYQDPNLNVECPFFMIHGNHDDPGGESNLCAANLLEVAGLCNYFGRHEDLEDIVIRPLLLSKGRSQVAIYGLGNIRDERLHRAFQARKVRFETPVDPDKWFHVMILHQNRHKGNKHGVPSKACIHEEMLPSFLDLVIWGHEHDCQESLRGEFYVIQPGSSVATSLTPGEAGLKHIALIDLKQGVFRCNPVPLWTVRPLVMRDIVLSETGLLKTDTQAIVNCVEVIAPATETLVLVLEGPAYRDQKIHRTGQTWLVSFETWEDVSNDYGAPWQQVPTKLFDCYQNPKDTTWCTQAFPTDTKNVIGLSYGIGGRDLWSERLSEAKILTRLYDCEAKSLSASNGTKPCSNVGPKSVPCYATPYELYHTCITAGETSPFEAVRQHLSNRDPLSVHMKIDLGAASLDMLEWIRTSGEVGKLRTLDITLQVGASRSGSKSTGTEQIVKDIETLEGFRELMQLSGSSLEFMAEQWLKLRTCASQCEEPPVYSPGGVPLNQPFSLSFIHGDLLS